MPPMLRPESKHVQFCHEKHTPNLSDKSATKKRTHTLRAKLQNMSSNSEETRRRQIELIIN